MRISDWSSDVCSSYLEIKIVLAGDVLRDLQQNLLDLAHPLAEPLIEAAAQLLRLALQGFGVRLQLRPLLGIGLRRQRGAALGKVAEIGRASCRERVCQYVEISVVAVSLKKKKKTIKDN